jgi:ankyrin repeat protein
LYRLGSKHRGATAMALIDGATLLICAVLCHNPSQVRWLVDVVKVPLQTKNKLGMTALDIARLKGYTVIESILLEAEERARGVNSC